MSRDRSKIALSLFSGAGGFDLGIKEAGFNVLAAIEMDPFCCETLKYNIKNRGEKTKVYCDDIQNIRASQLCRDLKLAPGDLDLLFGGPPCQSFSAIGKQRGVEDPRGQLIFQMIRFARAFKPKYVLMEQVVGFANFAPPDGEQGEVKNLLINCFEKLGYRVNTAILNAANYGVPQKRKRFFLVAHRKSLKFQFPNPTHLDTLDMLINNRYVTVGDVLVGLGAALPKGSKNKNSHIDVTPLRDRERIEYVEEGGNLANSNAPDKIKGRLTKKDTTKFLRLNRDGLSNTLRCGEILVITLLKTAISLQENICEFIPSLTPIY